MIKTTPDKLPKSEPIQWGLDYINESLEFLMDSEIEQDYKLEIIFSSGKNLAHHYQSLLKKEAMLYKSTLIADNWEAGKLMALRLLVKATPCPAQSYIHPVDKLMFYYIYNLKYLSKFFTSINLINCRNLIPKSFIREVLEIAEKNGLNLDCLKSNGYPLLICSLPYEEKQPGCYFHSFHTAVLFANSHNETVKKHLILHELGHALFNLSNNNKSSNKLFNALLALLKKYHPYSKVISVKPFQHRYMEEVFADSLATYFLSDQEWEERTEGERQEKKDEWENNQHGKKPIPPDLEKAIKLYLENLKT